MKYEYSDVWKRVARLSDNIYKESLDSSCREVGYIFTDN